MIFTIYTADCTGNERNAVYPHKAVITNGAELKGAVAFNHVCAAFKENYRRRENFIASDVVVMDCDNNHSENPADWVTEERFLAMVPDMAVAIVPSRNNMKPKDGKCARPRFHVYFPVSEVEDEAMYAEMKRVIHHRFPFFDGAALDAARFIYGCAAENVLWQEGSQSILAVIESFPKSSGSIPQGKRNSTMSRFAGRVIKRYGATEKAYQIFFEEAEKCDPPLEDAELNRIW